jgi:hypothetical protein
MFGKSWTKVAENKDGVVEEIADLSELQGTDFCK